MSRPTPVSRVTKNALEGELTEIADQLDELEKQRLALEDRRRALFLRGEKLGVSHRTMAPWVRLTGPRVHQIARGPVPSDRDKARARGKANMAAATTP